MENLRNKLFEIELQIKLAKLEKNEDKISKLNIEKEQIKKEIIEITKEEKKEGKRKW